MPTGGCEPGYLSLALRHITHGAACLLRRNGSDTHDACTDALATAFFSASLNFWLSSGVPCSRGGRMAHPEHDVMARILAHDPVAFETLFSRYSAVVRHQLQRMVRDTAAAEDLMQEVFLRVWQRAEQWQGHGTLHAW